MSTIFCRSAKAALILGACLVPALTPGLASAQYTEYVVQAPAPETPDAEQLRGQLLDLIHDQAPTLEQLRAQDQALRDRQRPDVERLNAEMRALIESQHETRDALASDLRRLSDDQKAYLNLHPGASEEELAALRAEMQALKDRQRPVREKMKDGLLALIDRQRPEREALRQERLDLREAQRPIRERVLHARADLEARIEYASADDEAAPKTETTASRTAGLPGLEQFGATGSPSSSGQAKSFVPADWSKPAIGQMPVKLDRPMLPGAADTQ